MWDVVTVVVWRRLDSVFVQSGAADKRQRLAKFCCVSWCARPTVLLRVHVWHVRIHLRMKMRTLSVPLSLGRKNVSRRKGMDFVSAMDKSVATLPGKIRLPHFGACTWEQLLFSTFRDRCCVPYSWHAQQNNSENLLSALKPPH